MMTDHLIQRRPPGSQFTRGKSGDSPRAQGRISRPGSALRYRVARARRLALSGLGAGRAGNQSCQWHCRAYRRNCRGSARRLPISILALGDAWRLAGNASEAAGAYEAAVKSSPHSARAARSLGATLKDLGQNTRARGIVADRRSSFARRCRPLCSTLGLLESQEGHAKEALLWLDKADALES